MTLKEDKETGEWVCLTEGCGFVTTDEDEAYPHSKVCDGGHELTKRGLLIKDLEGQLADFRRRVEQEFALQVCTMLERSAAASHLEIDKMIAAGGQMVGAADKRMEAAAYRAAAAAVRSMAGLEP